MRITALRDNVTAGEIDDLAAMLVSCVASGASLGYMADLDMATARQYWQGRLDAARASQSLLLAASDAYGLLVGSVQLALLFPPNQPHVAGVNMLMVLPSARRQGIARALMTTLEGVARDLDKTLAMLQTARGSEAEALYTTLGYQAAGIVPGYALWPDGRPCDGVIYWKALGAVKG